MSDEEGAAPVQEAETEAEAEPVAETEPEKVKPKTITDDVCVAMNAEMFKDLFDLATAVIISEVQMQIKDDGLYVRQMEEVHICLTDMFIPKSYFVKLKQGQQVKELVLNVEEMRAILRKLYGGDIVEFTVVKGKLHIEIEGKRMRVFNVPLIESEETERRIPKIPTAVRVKTSIEGLLLGLEDAQTLLNKGQKGKKKANIYGQVSLTTEPMGLKIESLTDDEMRSSGAMLTSGWDIMQFEGKMNQSVSVAIPYLMGITKAVSKATNMVQIEYTADMPLHIIAELPFKGMVLEFWIAPRIRIEGEVKGGESKVES